MTVALDRAPSPRSVGHGRLKRALARSQIFPWTYSTTKSHPDRAHDAIATSASCMSSQGAVSIVLSCTRAYSPTPLPANETGGQVGCAAGPRGASPGPESVGAQDAGLLGPDGGEQHPHRQLRLSVSAVGFPPPRGESPSRRGGPCLGPSPRRHRNRSLRAMCASDTPLRPVSTSGG